MATLTILSPQPVFIHQWGYAGRPPGGWEFVGNWCRNCLLDRLSTSGHSLFLCNLGHTLAHNVISSYSAVANIPRFLPPAEMKYFLLAENFNVI